MTLDAGFLYAFFLVFVRAGAMMLASPIFGAQHTPLPVRILTTLSIAGALAAALPPAAGSAPADLWTMAANVAHEAAAGLILGTVLSLVFFAIQMAGSFLDFQIGLGSSQILNPVTGVPVTIVAQMKFMLALVVFLSMNGHHAMFSAFLESYRAMPGITADGLNVIQSHFVGLLGQMSLLALQIAAPVAAVAVIVDAALGMVNRAVPQMQVMIVGMPAKILLGFLALCVTLPAVVAGVQSGVDRSLGALGRMWADSRTVRSVP